ncbi:MAG: hypothetical protein EBZ78_08535 [Verrucomicrobia bacterium]|nr:hypothetical protein [Verrucomicrobiota bacterium]
MSRQLLLGTVMAFLLVALSSVRAQMADTIWEGNVTLSGLTLQKVQGGEAQSGPNLSNASVTLPLEIWFWNDSNCGVVFRRDKWGLNPEEFAYMSDVDLDGNPLPEWVAWYKKGPKYVGGGSLSPITYNSNGYETTTDRYTYNASKKTGTFLQKTIYNYPNETHASGAMLDISGGFRLSNPGTLVPQKIVLSLRPNPFGPNSYRTSGRVTVRAGNFTKTARKPSIEKNVQPGFRSYYYIKE